MNISLIPLTRENVEHLLSLRNHEDFIEYCTHRRNTVSLQELISELDYEFLNDKHSQFLISHNNEIVGTIWSYSYSKTSKYCFFSIFLIPSSRKSFIGAAATALLFEQLFFKFDMYKIYAEVYSHNEKSKSTLTSAGFIEEGHFKNHKLKKDGARIDLLRFAFYRESYFIIERVLGFIRK